jgi:hypothetical protein
MPKYQLVTEDKIIGYDDVSNKVKIYKPQDATMLSLTDEEIKELLQVVKHYPQGGSMTVDEIRKLKQKEK